MPGYSSGEKDLWVKSAISMWMPKMREAGQVQDAAV